MYVVQSLRLGITYCDSQEERWFLVWLVDPFLSFFHLFSAFVV